MAVSEQPASTEPRRKIALALQGGGAHGAFTWGVLDRLLEDDTLEVVGVTGTSAGAMNAVVLADGLVKGGPAEARRALRRFWQTIGGLPSFASLLAPLSGAAAAGVRLEYTPPYLWWDMLSRNLSPYDLNPANYNPMRAPLAEMIDFERLRAQEDIQVMVCATNVHTARRRVFTNSDISIDAVLASACLPQLFPAVQIDGEAYWDGGYTGNPALAALIRRLPACDLIVVRIDPVTREATPRGIRDIHDRVLEISFNSTFWLELSAIAVVLRLVDEGKLDRGHYGRILFHVLEAGRDMERLAPSSKLNTYGAFLEHLFGLGRQVAEGWLATHREAIGRRSTVDFQDLLPVEEA